MLHGDQIVELSVLLGVHEKGEVEEDGEGQVEVEKEEGEPKSLSVCTLNCTALGLHAFMTLGHCVLTGFPITSPGASSPNILFDPLPLAPPRVSNWTLWGAQGSMMEQIRRVTQQVKMKAQAKSGR